MGVLGWGALTSQPGRSLCRAPGAHRLHGGGAGTALVAAHLRQVRAAPLVHLSAAHHSFLPPLLPPSQYGSVGRGAAPHPRDSHCSDMQPSKLLIGTALTAGNSVLHSPLLSCDSPCTRAEAWHNSQHRCSHTDKGFWSPPPSTIPLQWGNGGEVLPHLQPCFLQATNPPWFPPEPPPCPPAALCALGGAAGADCC